MLPKLLQKAHKERSFVTSRSDASGAVEADGETIAGQVLNAAWAKHCARANTWVLALMVFIP